MSCGRFDHMCFPSVANQPKLHSVAKDKLAALLKPGGLAVCIGGNSNGFGLSRHMKLRQVIMISHTDLSR